MGSMDSLAPVGSLETIRRACHPFSGRGGQKRNSALCVGIHHYFPLCVGDASGPFQVLAHLRLGIDPFGY